MVFSAVSTVSLFEAGHDPNDYAGVGRELLPPSKNKTTVCFVAVKSKVEQEKLYSTTDSSSWKRNSLVPCSQQLNGQQ